MPGAGPGAAGQAKPKSTKNVLEKNSFTKAEADDYLTASGFVRRSSVHNPHSVGLSGIVYDGTEDTWERKVGSETTRMTIIYIGGGGSALAQPDYVKTEVTTDP